jgi:predicted ribosome quality control (RQC) complex YloA/Tae2 family protein
MDGLAIAASLSELRGAVEGALIRNVYQPQRELFLLRLSGSPGAKVLICPKAASIQWTRLDIPNPPKASNFAMLLRKHLRGGRVVGVSQRGLDRIVTFDVERRIGATIEVSQLIAELAGLRGNLLLVRDGLVVAAGRRDDRNRPGRPYEGLRPQSKIHPSAVTVEIAERLLGEAHPTRAMSRAIDGVGLETAEDILRAASTEDDATVSERVRQELQRVWRATEAPGGFLDRARLRATHYALPQSSEHVGSFSEALDWVAGQEGGGSSASHRARVRSRLLRELGRRERTASKLADWLEASETADRLRRNADLLLTFRSDLPDGSSSVTVTDPETALPITIHLDPSMGVIENAQRLHGRAKRLKRGRPHVEARLKRLEREIAALREGLEAIDEGAPVPASVEKLASAPKERVERGEPSSRRWRSIDGFTVLVGRDARENDLLLREASPDDVWMHARGAAGSHVVVRRGGRREIPEGVLRKAAGLAAHHSKARGERRVAVTVAAVKHVRKPKGAPPGLVIVESEDTLTVDPGLREWE